MKRKRESRAKPKRHVWKNSDTCVRCKLHREGAGAGPYGAMRYYRDGSRAYGYKPGPCELTCSSCGASCEGQRGDGYLCACGSDCSSMH
jgi:hypothetical protein